MSLLDEIIKGAVDSKSDLATILRNCLILADSLDHPGFNEWVEHELNGYPPGMEPPPYRVLTGVRSIGDFFGVAGSQMRNIPLPTANVPEPLRKRISAVPFRQGVGGIEALVAGSDEDLQSPWPPDLIARVGRLYIAGQTLMAAHIEIPRAAIIGVLDAIRNRVLRFALEIRKKAPQAGEPSAGAALPKEQVGHIFNTYVLSGTQNVAVGSSNFSQTVQHVQAGDFASLASLRHTRHGRERGHSSSIRRSPRPMGPDGSFFLVPGMAPHSTIGAGTKIYARQKSRSAVEPPMLPVEMKNRGAFARFILPQLSRPEYFALRELGERLSASQYEVVSSLIRLGCASCNADGGAELRRHLDAWRQQAPSETPDLLTVRG